MGAAAKEVLDLTKDNPRFKEPIVEGSTPVLAEAVYGVREEMATAIEDILARRTGLQFFSWEKARAAAPAVGVIMARDWAGHRVNRRMQWRDMPAKLTG